MGTENYPKMFTCFSVGQLVGRFRSLVGIFAELYRAPQFRALKLPNPGRGCERIHCESSSFMLIFKLSLSSASLPLTEIVDKDESRS
jgi:hypothetical protein